jgi:hypothetical protein
MNRGTRSLYACVVFILALNIALWTYSRDLRPQWGNVPPVPSAKGAALATLGDSQMAYRVLGLMLQNLGSMGGQTEKFENYRYDRLRGWFFLEHRLDPESNFVPALAAYYYGATHKVDDLSPVIDYLQVAGQEPEPQKWRWLAQAVYLARYQQGDLNRALELANLLAGLKRNDMPLWARQMPAFVMNAQGDKQAAYALMVSILNSSAKELNPIEVRFIRDYVCERILNPDQAAQDKLCSAAER